MVEESADERQESIEESPPEPPSIFIIEWYSFAGSVIGVLVALLGVFLAAYKVLKNNKTFNRLLSSLSSSEKEELDRQTERELQSLATQILLTTSSDRVLILEKHNGDHYKSGRSRERYSVVSEEIANTGFKYAKSKFQDIPQVAIEEDIDFNRTKTVFLDAVNQTLIINEEEYRLDDEWRNRILNIGAVSSYFISLRVNSEMAGIIAVNYFKSSKDCVKQFDDNKQEVMRLTGQVEAVLSKTYL